MAKFTNLERIKKYGHCGETPGPYRVFPSGIMWYVVNTNTGIGRKIGPAKLKGLNYFDRAMEVVEEKNSGN